MVKKYMKGKVVPTNADRNIGRTAAVIERIDNLAGTGAVRIDGVTWTARSADEQKTIEVGVMVTVREIRGVKLVVEPKTES